MATFIADAATPQEFENSVRQVARRLYSAFHSTGSVKIDGRERDEIIDTGTELVIIEATMLRTKVKTESDLAKSISLVRYLRGLPNFSDYNFRILLVTFHEPTADQAGVVKDARAGCPKEIISFSTLFSRLFDARQYLRQRDFHFFGSIRNPANERDYDVPSSAYIPTALSDKETGQSLTATDLARLADHGTRAIIFGDYGSGKSMTLRDVYLRARQSFQSGQSLKCPVYLNLREHTAQTQPDEALLRHAEKIGFADYHSLISAWKSGYVTVFLDGFDEITPPSFGITISSLRQARRFAVELIKRFFEQTPVGSSVILAGRESYFDTREEAYEALGVGDFDRVFDLAGFTDQQIARYLNKNKFSLPNWLPTRPLLLGYLANYGLISDQDKSFELSPAEGWSTLLDRICAREVNQIWGVGYEPSALRKFIERLASKSRQNGANRPLQDSDIKMVFLSTFGRDADEPANLLASRLPGLGSPPGQANAREFIDQDFFSVAAAGDLARFIESPFTEQNALAGARSSLDSLSTSVAHLMSGSSLPRVNTALVQASGTSSLSITVADLIAIINDNQGSYTGSSIIVSGGDIDSMSIEPDVDLSNVTFSNCTFGTIEFGRSEAGQENANFPSFYDCMIDKVAGVQSSADLPSRVLSGTSVESYIAYAATNNAVLESDLEVPVKVLLTILRKLFMQRGSGRQYSALRRGLPSNSTKYVTEITTLIKAKGFAEDVRLDNRNVLIPNRSRSSEALSILNAPRSSDSPLICEVRKLA